MNETIENDEENKSSQIDDDQLTRIDMEDEYEIENNAID